VNERDHSFAHEYHSRLIEATRVERQTKAGRPKWSDQLLLQLGNFMISFGQRLKDSSAIAQPADLTQECA
jgi:hypothetical protein